MSSTPTDTPNSRQREILARMKRESEEALKVLSKAKAETEAIFIARDEAIRQKHQAETEIKKLEEELARAKKDLKDARASTDGMCTASLIAQAKAVNTTFTEADKLSAIEKKIVDAVKTLSLLQGEIKGAQAAKAARIEAERLCEESVNYRQSELKKAQEFAEIVKTAKIAMDARGEELLRLKTALDFRESSLNQYSSRLDRYARTLLAQPISAKK